MTTLAAETPPLGTRAVWCEGADLVHGTIVTHGRVVAVMESVDRTRVHFSAVVAMVWFPSVQAYVHASAWTRVDGRQEPMPGVLEDDPPRPLRGVWRWRRRGASSGHGRDTYDARQAGLPGIE